MTNWASTYEWIICRVVQPMLYGVGTLIVIAIGAVAVVFAVFFLGEKVFGPLFTWLFKKRWIKKLPWDIVIQCVIWIVVIGGSITFIWLLGATTLDKNNKIPHIWNYCPRVMEPAVNDNDWMKEYVRGGEDLGFALGFATGCLWMHDKYKIEYSRTEAGRASDKIWRDATRRAK